MVSLELARKLIGTNSLSIMLARNRLIDGGMICLLRRKRVNQRLQS